MIPLYRPCWWPDCRNPPTVKVTIVDSARSVIVTCNAHLPAVQRSRRRYVMTFEPATFSPLQKPPDAAA